MTRSKTNKAAITAEDVLAAIQTEGDGIFYYRQPGSRTFFLSRDVAVQAIVDYLSAFYSPELPTEMYDIESIANELIQEIAMPADFMFRGYTGPVFALPGDRRTIDCAINRHSSSAEQLAVHIQKRMGTIQDLDGRRPRDIPRVELMKAELDAVDALASAMRSDLDLMVRLMS